MKIFHRKTYVLPVVLLLLAIGFVSCKKADTKAVLHKHLTDRAVYRHISQSRSCSKGGYFVIAAYNAFGGGFDMTFKRGKSGSIAEISIEHGDTILDSIRIAHRAILGADSVISEYVNEIKRYQPDSTNYVSFDGIRYFVEICELDSNRSIALAMPGKYPDTPNRNALMDKFGELLSKVDVQNTVAKRRLEHYRKEAVKLEQ